MICCVHFFLQYNIAARVTELKLFKFKLRSVHLSGRFSTFSRCCVFRFHSVQHTLFKMTLTNNLIYPNNQFPLSAHFPSNANRMVRRRTLTQKNRTKKQQYVFTNWLLAINYLAGAQETGCKAYKTFLLNALQTNPNDLESVKVNERWVGLWVKCALALCAANWVNVGAVDVYNAALLTALHSVQQAIEFWLDRRSWAEIFIFSWAPLLWAHGLTTIARWLWSYRELRQNHSFCWTSWYFSSIIYEWQNPQNIPTVPGRTPENKANSIKPHKPCLKHSIMGENIIR